jgi:hypothetical protein
MSDIRRVLPNRYRGVAFLLPEAKKSALFTAKCMEEPSPEVLMRVAFKDILTPVGGIGTGSLDLGSRGMLAALIGPRISGSGPHEAPGKTAGVGLALLVWVRAQIRGLRSRAS